MGLLDRRKRDSASGEGDGRAADAATLAAPGGLDAGWYSALVGRSMSKRKAVAHYLRVGAAQGLTPHPFFDPMWFARSKTTVPSGTDPFAHYLRTPDLWSTPTHPLLDTRGYLARHPESLNAPGGPPEHLRTLGLRTGERPSGRWPEGVAVLPRLTEWCRVLAGQPPVDTVVLEPNGPMVLLAMGSSLPRLRLLLDSLERDDTAARAPVLLSTAGLARPLALHLCGLSLEYPWLSVEVTPTGAEPTAAWDRLTADQEAVVLLDTDVEVEPGWLGPLLDAVADRSVGSACSVVADPRGVIRSAGGEGLLAGFAADELVAAGPSGPAFTTIPAAAPGALALRPQDIAGSGGWPARLDAVEWAELSRRCARAAEAPVVVCHASRVVRVDGPEPLPDPHRDGADAWAAFDMAAGGVRALPRPRQWAIKCPALPGAAGETWGDLHFARELADALRRQGQRVVIDRAPAFDRPTAALDDVALLLRGLRSWEPVDGPLSVMWVISHPDDVTAEEAAGHARVFAASGPWATSRTWGSPVEPLLQATDPQRFHPGVAEPDTGPEVLFVGVNKGGGRPLVEWAVEAGLPLSVYGPGWSSLPDGMWVGDRLPRDEVPALYRSAGLVLCEHAAEMAAEGFVQNRVLDVLAAGGRAVSNPVAGLSDTVPGVAVVSGPDELRRLFDLNRGEVFGDDGVVRERAAEVAAAHSFDARATTLIEWVSALA